MATFTELREALAAVIERGQIDGLTVLSRRPGSVPVLPAVWPQPATAQYAVPTERRGMDVYQVQLIIAVSMTDIDLAQHQMDELLAKHGSSSIRALIKADSHLGLGPTTTAWVDSLTYGTDAFPGLAQDVLGATLHVQVRTDA